MGLTMKPRIMVKFLEANGYRFLRAKGGSHRIYSNGKHSLPLPIHGKDYGEDFIQMVLTEIKVDKTDLLKFLKR